MEPEVNLGILYTTVMSGPELHGELLGVTKAQATYTGALGYGSSSKEALRDDSVRLLTSGSGGIVQITLTLDRPVSAR